MLTFYRCLQCHLLGGRGQLRTLHVLGKTEQACASPWPVKIEQYLLPPYFPNLNPTTTLCLPVQSPCYWNILQVLSPFYVHLHLQIFKSNMIVQEVYTKVKFDWCIKTCIYKKTHPFSLQSLPHAPPIFRWWPRAHSLRAQPCWTPRTPWPHGRSRSWRWSCCFLSGRRTGSPFWCHSWSR